MILTDYIYWHYAVAPMSILGLLRNYLTGAWHRFLVSTHFKTLFAPWHRANPSDVGAAHSLDDRVLNSIVDFYIRIIAAIVRLVIILTGLIFEVILMFAFMALFIVWLLWPVVLIVLILRGFALI